MRRRNGLIWGAAGGLAWCGPPALAADSVIRVCIDDSPHPPWRVPDADGRLRSRGLEFDYLHMLGAETGLRLQPLVQPWRRCLSDVRSGDVDAVMAISHQRDREAFIRYPMRDGEPDPARAVRQIQNVLVVAADAAANWDGQHLLLQGGKQIGIQAGYATATWVREQGFKVDETARTVRGTLERLLGRQVQAVLLSRTAFLHQLQQEPSLQPRLRMLAPSLPARVHYLGLSSAFAQRHPELPELLWSAGVRVRESAEFRKAETEAMNS